MRAGAGSTRAGGDQSLGGGNFVGAGSFGCVYQPPLPDRGAEIPLDRALIGKVLPAPLAEQSVRQMRLVAAIDPSGRFGFYARSGRSFEIDADAGLEAAGGEPEVRRCNVQDMQGFVRGLQMPGAMATHAYRELVFDAATDGTLEAALAHEAAFSDAAGPSLDRLRAALGALQNCFQGLAHYHALGVVHRDVKPDNIMLTRDKGGLVVAKFIDFDFAVRISDAQSALTLGSPYTPLLTFAVSSASAKMLLADTVKNFAELFAAQLRSPWVPAWLVGKSGVFNTASRAGRNVSAFIKATKIPLHGASALYKDTYALAGLTLAELYYAHTCVRFVATDAAAAATSAPAPAPLPNSASFVVAAKLHTARSERGGADGAVARAYADMAARLASVSEAIGRLCFDATVAAAWAPELNARFQGVLDLLSRV